MYVCVRVVTRLADVEHGHELGVDGGVAVLLLGQDRLRDVQPAGLPRHASARPERNTPWPAAVSGRSLGQTAPAFLPRLSYNSHVHVEEVSGTESSSQSTSPGMAIVAWHQGT